MHVAVIGGGNMGEAIIAALLREKVLTSDEVTVSDINPSRLEQLARQYGITTSTDNGNAVEGAEVVILAVKPQTFESVAGELKTTIKNEQLVLSIIAGVSIEKLSWKMNHRRIVRAMPNIPAQIGEGMTVWIATPGVSKAQKGKARTIIRAMGDDLYVEEEKYIDMATAISGSGPAYLFYFTEALVNAAQTIGWSPEEAEKLVMQTLHGSVKLLQHTGYKPSELRKAVTSPGGTTAAAIDRMEKDDFAGCITRAVEAAYHRAQEIGK